jgi:putative membrane protein
MHILMHLAVLAATILILSWLLPSVRIRSVGTAVTVAVVFSVLNFLLGWLIWALLLVPAVLTLGLLFLFIPFIVNALVLWLTDMLIANFEIETTGGLLVSAAVITLVNGVFNAPLLRAAALGHVHGSYLQPDWI